MEPLIVSKLEVVRQTISFAISGDKIPLATLKQIGRQIENDIRAIDGISQIQISGYPEEEIEIAVNENNLLAFNLSFAEVAQAVGNANILVTGGNIKTNAEEYLIRANNRSYYGDEFSNIIVRADPSGQTVRLKDVATIRDRFSETPNAAYFNGNLSVNTTITSTNTEDLIGSAEKVKAYLEEFNQKYDNVKLSVVSDLSDLENVFYDILVFFSPSGIDSLLHNFPDFKQNDTRIAVFGNTTIKAVEEAGLRVDIAAPTPETPSMTMALEKYIEKVNKGK